MYLLNACTQSLRQNEKWELLNDVCANVSLKLLIIFVSKDLLLISIHDTFLIILVRNQCRATVLMITKKEVFTEEQICQQQYADMITIKLFRPGVGIMIIEFSLTIKKSPYKQCLIAYFLFVYEFDTYSLCLVFCMFLSPSLSCKISISFPEKIQKNFI